jgi:hypothetical protein
MPGLLENSRSCRLAGQQFFSVAKWSDLAQTHCLIDKKSNKENGFVKI